MGDIENLLLIQNRIIDTKALRDFCIYGRIKINYYKFLLGIPDKFRPLCWRLFLDFLPKERHMWIQVLKKQRNYYENLVENILSAVPSGNNITNEFEQEVIHDHVSYLI